MPQQHEGFESANSETLHCRIPGAAVCAGILLIGFLCLSWFSKSSEDAARKQEGTQWDIELKSMNKIVKQPSKLVLLVEDDKVSFVGREVAELEQWLAKERSVMPFRQKEISGRDSDDWQKNPNSLRCGGWWSENGGHITLIAWWDVNGTCYELDSLCKRDDGSGGAQLDTFRKVDRIPSFERAKAMTTFQYQTLFTN
jgi:hypothetical protein